MPVSGFSINYKEKVFEKFSDEEFWRNAFDKGAPFYESYVKYFRKGIVEEIPGLLDAHREAIYYTNTHALMPIIVQLIVLSVKYPESSFIETLALFLSNDDCKDRLIVAFSDADSTITEKVLESIVFMSSYLEKTGDDDLSVQLNEFKMLLESRKS